MKKELTKMQTAPASVPAGAHVVGLYFVLSYMLNPSA